MPDANRTITASTTVSSETDAFLDERAAALGIDRPELLRRLVQHYRDAREAGLDCPHCKNAVEIDL